MGNQVGALFLGIADISRPSPWSMSRRVCVTHSCASKRNSLIAMDSVEDEDGMSFVIMINNIPTKEKATLRTLPIG